VGDIQMSAIASKDVMFIYNDNEENVEVEFDAEGDVPIPIDGSIVKRHGKQWKVSLTNLQSASSGAKAMLVLRIDFTDRF
jgi:hypothetical protein